MSNSYMLGFFPKRARMAVALTALSLLAIMAVAGSWHSDGQERGCPVCQFTQITVVQPAGMLVLNPPTLVEIHTPASVFQAGSQVVEASHAPRAPPISA